MLDAGGNEQREQKSDGDVDLNLNGVWLGLFALVVSIFGPER